MNWVADNLGLIGALTLEHLRQSVVPIVLGLVISVPLGWLAWRYPLIGSGIVTLTGLLYTIPSLALLLLLPAMLGFSIFSDLNLVVALTVYAVALLVRSVADGLRSVDADVRQASVAVGYGAFRRFWAVELPLAGPVILAGLRVTAVSTISLATVGILVGVRNLGYLFTNGYQREIVPEILAGVVVVVLLALVVDGLLLAAGRVLMPWSTRAGSAHVRRIGLQEAGA